MLLVRSASVLRAALTSVLPELHSREICMYSFLLFVFWFFDLCVALSGSPGTHSARSRWP